MHVRYSWEGKKNLFVALLLMLSCFHTGQAIDKHDQLEGFFDQLCVNYLSRDSFLLSQLGDVKPLGMRLQQASLNDISPEALMQDFQDRKINLQVLEQYLQENPLSAQMASYKVLHHWLTSLVAGEKFLFHEYKITQMTGFICNLSAFFTQYHPLETLEDVEHYIVRLTKVPLFFQQAIEFLDYQKDLGIKYPSCAIEKTINLIKKFMTEHVSENIFYTRLAGQIDRIPGVDGPSLLALANAVIQEAVYPAYQELLSYCKTMSEQTQGYNHGVWALPQGDEYYAYILDHHTNASLSADEIHELGLREVSRIQNEMRALLATEGFADQNKPVGELVNELAQDSRFYFPETEAGRQQCLAGYYAILERSRTELAHLFDLKPKSQLTIQPVPKHEEDGMPGAYYFPPSIDGLRSGIFFANLRSMSEVPIYGMETLLIHEAEPGHHFQIALQQESDMHVLRKVIVQGDLDYTSYIEGWALYAEKLAYEQGFYSSSFSCLGHLRDELLRAVRLVVDTGIHKKRWTREQAIDYMVQETGFHRDSVVTEVERYFVIPGQACAYKIGQLKILELRKRAQDVLGNKFDIREFHNVVLTLGAAPLTILEEVIDQYIQSKIDLDSGSHSR